MVVKDNDGVHEITSVDIICEKRVEFNGKNIRLVQLANQITDASALRINLNVSSCFNLMPFGEDSIFIGNLKNAVLQELVDSLAKAGCIDITKLKLQKKKAMLPEKYIFDDGVSLPYRCSGNIGINSNYLNFYNNEIVSCFNADDSDEAEIFPEDKDSDVEEC